DLDRRPRDWPRSERGADRCGKLGICEREAEPDTAKPIALGERAQHEDAGQRQMRRKAQAIAFEIGKRLIDNEQSIPSSLSRQRKQCVSIEARTSGLLWLQITAHGASASPSSLLPSTIRHPAASKLRAYSP